MITCTNMSSSLFAFFLNNHYTICIILLIAAALVQIILGATLIFVKLFMNALIKSLYFLPLTIT